MLQYFNILIHCILLRPFARGIIYALSLFTLLSPALADEITVFAAASTTEAINEIAHRFQKGTGITVRVSVAGSSALARQIEYGAPADLFLSANSAWMDYLQERKLIDPASRIDLATNRLVLIAPASSPVRLDLADGANLAGALQGGRFALPDPDHVPAGIYGKQALMALHLWRQVQSRIVPASNVRSALALVSRGEASLGVVYATDAAIQPEVRIIGTFPQESHSLITYPAAIVSGRRRPASERLLDFMKGPVGREIFMRRGFLPPP
jgi:molybdate transport system substrate-binding protein